MAALGAEAGLKMPDCCVLLAAEDYDGIIASFDAACSPPLVGSDCAA